MTPPLPNRVRPDGALVACPARGAFTGNRGRLCDGERRLAGSASDRVARRWTTRAWICCALAWRGRRQPLTGPGWTPLFFLDEATALAAGHRPCFACRRAEALAFAAAWGAAQGLGRRASAAEMDAALHRERLGPRPEVETAAAPVGAMLEAGDGFALVSRRGLLPWSPEGYGPPVPPPARARLVTPASAAAALGAGYAAQAHPSAGD